MLVRKKMDENYIMVDFSYYCYRCGHLNELPLDSPDAPAYNHVDLTCGKCGDGTRVLLASCPNPDCKQYVYWINDISIPEIVTGFAKYMVHNMQTMIDKAALQGAEISIDTPHNYPINASCPCGTDFSVDITIPDLD